MSSWKVPSGSRHILSIKCSMKCCRGRNKLCAQETVIIIDLIITQLRSDGMARETQRRQKGLRKELGDRRSVCNIRSIFFFILSLRNALSTTEDVTNIISIKMIPTYMLQRETENRIKGEFKRFDLSFGQSWCIWLGILKAKWTWFRISPRAYDLSFPIHAVISLS